MSISDVDIHPQWLLTYSISKYCFDLNLFSVIAALDNKILVTLTTDYPFSEDLLRPPTSMYKNTKRDFENSVSATTRLYRSSPFV